MIRRFTLILVLSLVVMSAKAAPASLPNFDKLWNYDQPAQTRARFKAILPKAEAAGDREYTNELLTQIARTYSLEGRFDAAKVVLDQVERQLPERPDLATVRYYLELGRTMNSAGHPRQAKPLFEQAFHLARQLRADYYAIDAAHMVAIVANSFAAQRKWSRLGLQLAAQSTDKRARGWRGPIANNLGWDYFDAGNYEKALTLFQQAYHAFKETGSDRQIDIARWTVARCLRALGRDKEALAIQLELLKVHQQTGTEDGRVYEELGELYLARGEKDKATGYFRKAYKLLSANKWLMVHEPKRMARLKSLGGVAR